MSLRGDQKLKAGLALFLLAALLVTIYSLWSYHANTTSAASDAPPWHRY